MEIPVRNRLQRVAAVGGISFIVRRRSKKTGSKDEPLPKQENRIQRMTTHTRNRIRRFKEVATESPELISWWVRFVHQCPDMATAADLIDVIDREEAIRRTSPGTWSGKGDARADTEAGWVFFASTPPLQFFTQYLMASLAKSEVWHGDTVEICRYLGGGIARMDQSLVSFGRRIFEAFSRWTVEDVEKRLGMSIGSAYSQAGMIPFWACGHVGLQKGLRHLRDLERYEEMEPKAFLDECLEGLAYQDSFCCHYAFMLLGPTPEIPEDLRC